MADLILRPCPRCGHTRRIRPGAAARVYECEDCGASIHLSWHTVVNNEDQPVLTREGGGHAG